ncbi:hypothetical protein QA640_24030 [Bradyrhizobium sp. CB82]|uniref:hypothetical protein n=1 Tax=Bradyrhizobium sp. CB82 TaxID=3039159 RepID=UPI0024B24ECA|nr:hypothetical protein [Bradyrhizobium sp. CB82]WFU37545.1 hypothetical protein QA640_24030 [Bradyrhizobium sp. CB82]
MAVDGIPDFNALHSRRHDHEVQLDILVVGGDDLRSLPLHMRKANLEQLLARRPDGIPAAPFERGEIGPDQFRAACRMGLEGFLKASRSALPGGRQKFWIKVKNRSHPAMESASYRAGLGYCLLVQTQLVFIRIFLGILVVNGEAGCTLCSQARVLKALIPVARGYVLKVYECAGCSSNLRLVTRLRMPNKTRVKFSRRKKFKAIDAALKRAAALNKPARKSNNSKRADRLSTRSPLVVTMR